MDKEDIEFSGDFYDEHIWRIGKANGSGRRTAQMYFAHSKIDYSRYANAEISYDDNIVKGRYYWVVFDTSGKCGWKTDVVEYGGKKAKVLMVLTRSVKKEYLAHLKKMGIAYIIAGNDRIDLESALVKLKSLFGIETLALCGGPRINGGFLEKGLLDEISLVVAPYIEGDKGKRNFVETQCFVDRKFELKSFKRMKDGALHLTYIRK